MADTATQTVTVSQEVAVPPERVWALLTDLPRMGEWSPENTGGRWVKGSNGPALGARFRGSNRNGKRRWNTAVRVVRFDAPTDFAFDVTAVGFKVARWTFTLEPTDSGCRVSETWTDQRGRMAKSLGGPASGVAERAEHNRAGMETTLAKLAAAAEA